MESSASADARTSPQTATPATQRTLIDHFTRRGTPTPNPVAPPMESPLRRERAVPTPSESRTEPPAKKPRTCGRTDSTPTTLTASQIIAKHPGQSYEATAHNTQIFCRACKETKSLKKSTLDDHEKSPKHMKNLDLWKKLKTKDTEAHQFLAQTTFPSGEGSNLPEAHRLRRFNVVKTIMEAGIPIHKIDKLRNLLEDSNYSLTDSSHMAKLIPLVHTETFSHLSAAVKGQDIGCIFDGASRQGELICVVARWVQEETAVPLRWKVVQKLVRLHHCPVAVTGDELARILNDAISLRMGIPPSNIFSATHDRASVNRLGIAGLAPLWNQCFPIPCFAHLIDDAGPTFDCPSADAFMDIWHGIFAHSCHAKALFKELYDTTVQSYSETRWWSWWENVRQVAMLFPQITEFFQVHLLSTKMCPAYQKRGSVYLHPGERNRALRVELAVYQDVAEMMVKTTYNLEGDGPLVFDVYDQLIALKAHIDNPRTPTTDAVLVKIEEELNGTADDELFLLCARPHECIAPVQQYFQEKWREEAAALEFFKIARWFSPVHASAMGITERTVRDFATNFADRGKPLIPWLAAEVPGLLEDLPVYVDCYTTTSENVDLMIWWPAQRARLRTFAKCAKRLTLAQPTSGAAERVFSVYRRQFSCLQAAALEETLETSVMLEYNKE